MNRLYHFRDRVGFVTINYGVDRQYIAKFSELDMFYGTEPVNESLRSLELKFVINKSENSDIDEIPEVDSHFFYIDLSEGIQGLYPRIDEPYGYPDKAYSAAYPGEPPIVIGPTITMDLTKYESIFALEDEGEDDEAYFLKGCGSYEKFELPRIEHMRSNHIEYTDEQLLFYFHKTIR